MASIPSLFLSHGAPDTVIADTKARAFLASYSASLPRPEAIVVVSAHFEAGGVAISGDERPVTIHDFGGFAPELHEIRYPAPGSPDLAREIAELLLAEGMAAGVIRDRGFDHGVWTPLLLMYPAADIPVVQVSVDPHAGPDHHYCLGLALSPLRTRNILVIGSGSFTHNLRKAFAAMRTGERFCEPKDWVMQFILWMEEKLAAQDIDALLDYRRQAPFSVKNHPTEEHLMPLYAAIGAGGAKWSATKIHSSTEFGVLSMDAYAFT
ncbi:dioxygenase [Hoeflea sp. WL0058]|uniref:Dioxygenase n=1 Tax=Flavimaribacter sediminis TaxID=2865987 RepID=A0AAE2ZKP3_9HYPH|nr:class III extradiol ring-cleavage dioxygenase [Flavimaribacter sediminis]MBW8636432.1 dioxygenase [Flavimaribacter sediminis]